jgi:hypothetical protein
MPATKTPDYSKLVLHNGRLTRAFWILREGIVQDVRMDWVGNTKRADWGTSRYIHSLVYKGYLESVKGPRGGKDSFRTTGDGAFMMMVAEGINAAKREQSPTDRTTTP